jgi:hypothetical protein
MTDNFEPLYIKSIPVKGAHSKDVPGPASEGFNGGFHVGELFHEQVTMLAMCLDGSFNLEAHAVIP